MSFKKRQNAYITERLNFNFTTYEAWSYGWWKFCEVLKDGTLLWNTCGYSMQTGKQKRIIAELLRHNEINIYHYPKQSKDVRKVYAKCGLQNLEGEILAKKYEIKEIQKKIRAPKSRRSLDDARAEQISHLEGEILELRELIKLQRDPNSPNPRKPLRYTPKEKKARPEYTHKSSPQQENPQASASTNVVCLFTRKTLAL